MVKEDYYIQNVKIIAQRTVAKYSLLLRDDGILICRVIDERKWVPQDFKLLFRAIGEMADFKKIPFLVTFNKYVFPSMDAIRYWSDPKTSCTYISAEAQILDSLPLKILGNFYLSFSKPRWPTRFFNNKNEGLEFLKCYV